MKVKIPLFLLLLLAGAVGYLFGTERGRAQRDQVMGKISNKGADDSLAAEAAAVAEPAPDAPAEPAPADPPPAP